jgi:predicted nuclease of restriction endonuclease-like RecB superfamily
MANSKVKNATLCSSNGIQFKSKLEKTIYDTLVLNSFQVEYEPTKYEVQPGFKPAVPFYTKDLKTRELKLNTTKVIAITYTPDFIVRYNDITIVIEAKGFLTDSYHIKRKMFRYYLENNKSTLGNILYFEIYTKKQLLQAIDIIKHYESKTSES